MTDKEIQASDEEMEQFNVSQNEKCVSAKTEKLNDLMNKISFALKDDFLAQGFEIICKRISELEKENKELKEQIKKMKCCGNCKNIIELERSVYSKTVCTKCQADKAKSMWELAE